MPEGPHKKRPTDASQLAKLIVEIASGEVEDKPDYGDKNPAAVERGKAGGIKGGNARARSLTAEQRREIAKKAANVRWGNRSDS
jgi:hypothetical protein